MSPTLIEKKNISLADFTNKFLLDKPSVKDDSEVKYDSY